MKNEAMYLIGQVCFVILTLRLAQQMTKLCSIDFVLIPDCSSRYTTCGELKLTLRCRPVMGEGWWPHPVFDEVLTGAVLAVATALTVEAAGGGQSRAGVLGPAGVLRTASFVVLAAAEHAVRRPTLAITSDSSANMN